jgi:hypothetical protein
MKFICTLFLLSCLSVNAQAKVCNLPIPDGAPAGYKTSSANLDGKITAIDSTHISLIDKRTGKSLRVQLIENKSQIYSAFGGDIQSAELKIGQYVWVWYQGCKKDNREKIQTVGYLKVFSKNPSDQPDANSIRIGRKA